MGSDVHGILATGCDKRRTTLQDVDGLQEKRDRAENRRKVPWPPFHGKVAEDHAQVVRLHLLFPVVFYLVPSLARLGYRLDFQLRVLHRVPEFMRNDEQTHGV